VVLEGVGGEGKGWGWGVVCVRESVEVTTLSMHSTPSRGIEIDYLGMGRRWWRRRRRKVVIKPKMRGGGGVVSFIPGFLPHNLLSSSKINEISQNFKDFLKNMKSMLNRNNHTCWILIAGFFGAFAWRH
jgi:hypothetical protein